MPTFRTFDGLELHYDELGGVGTVVVLLHGFGSDSQRNWLDTGIAEALADGGLHVVALDARGHGRSDKPHDPERYRPPAMARDVVTLIDHLGRDTVHLVGYSLGVMTALTAAALDGRRIHRLVLAGSGSALLAAGSDEAFRRRRLGAAVLELDDASQLSDEAGKGLRAFVETSGGDRLALAAVMRAEEGPPPEALTVPNPALVLAGDADSSAGDPQALATVLPSGRAARVSGNHLTAVSDPELPRLILDFLDDRMEL